MKKRKINSLYIHIPFCNKICEYCDFTKVYYLKKFSKPYVDKLTLDLDKVRKLFCKFNTIYIGGGSPSALSFNELKKLLNKTKKLLKFNGEFTIELNPEDITIDKLIILKKNRVNRVSIGIQTFNEKILNEINRNYNINYFELISLVKKYFKNINVDFIYGFKNQTLEELKLDLSKFISLNINHISIYSLQNKRKDTELPYDPFEILFIVIGKHRLELYESAFK